MIDFIATIFEQKANPTEDPGHNQLIVFFKDFFKVILGIAGILLILHFAFNFHIGNLLTGEYRRSCYCLVFAGES